MLAVSRAAAPAAALTVADAQRLPLADGVADLALAPHMLYHVPDRAAAAAEFRRVTRPGGQVLVVLNGSDHLAELRALLAGTAADGEVWWGLTGRDLAAEYDGTLMMTLEAGQELLSGVFASVRRHDFTAELVLPSAEPVAAYVASMRWVQAAARPAEFAAAVTERIPFAPDGTFRVTTHSGVLICR